jgi:hypothetical protein
VNSSDSAQAASSSCGRCIAPAGTPRGGVSNGMISFMLSSSSAHDTEDWRRSGWLPRRPREAGRQSALVERRRLDLRGVAPRALANLRVHGKHARFEHGETIDSQWAKACPPAECNAKLAMNKEASASPAPAGPLRQVHQATRQPVPSSGRASGRGAGAAGLLPVPQQGSRQR